MSAPEIVQILTSQLSSSTKANSFASKAGIFHMQTDPSDIMSLDWVIKPINVVRMWIFHVQLQ